MASRVGKRGTVFQEKVAGRCGLKTGDFAKRKIGGAGHRIERPMSILDQSKRSVGR